MSNKSGKTNGCRGASNVVVIYNFTTDIYGIEEKEALGCFILVDVAKIH